MRNVPFQKHVFNAQSAMEYLMTYGWAILIIAVVLGALFQLGVFNASAFAPRAPPGACQVFRPNGPYSISVINLEGVCSGELPQYVDSYSYQGYVDIPMSSLSFTSSSPISVTLWFRTTNVQSTAQQISYFGSIDGSNACQGLPQLDTYTGSTFALDGCGNNYNTGLTIIDGNWHFIGFSYAGGGATTTNVFVDSHIQTATISAYSIPTSSSAYLMIGTAIGSGEGDRPIYGNIADYQVYNTSLSTNEIQYLYFEGIGGAPIKLSNLVGWWPLNGNANDYSGNNNNGVPSGVTYTSQWTSGYVQP